jgi:hypothetical protein
MRKLEGKLSFDARHKRRLRSNARPSLRLKSA